MSIKEGLITLGFYETTLIDITRVLLFDKLTRENRIDKNMKPFSFNLASMLIAYKRCR